MEFVWENLSELFINWWNDVIKNLPQVSVGIIIFVVSIYLSRLISKLVVRALKARKTDKEISILLERLVRWGVISLGLVIALQQAGQDVSALLTGLGILGFTIGFALQDVSANFVAGVLLLIQQPFDIGDYIEVAGYDGKVLTVDLRATDMLTGDGRRVTIPNGEVFSNPIINFTRTERRRISLPIGIEYDSDLEKVLEISIKAVCSIDGVLSDPGPAVAYGGFGDTAIDLTIHYWFSTKETSLLKAKNAGILAIKNAYDQAGIGMPFPTQTIELKN